MSDREILEEFEHGGLQCRLVKMVYSSGNFHYCGYVKLEGDLSWDEAQNLTTRDVSYGPDEDRWIGFGCIGFETNHGGEMADWDLDRVREELRQFAEELDREHELTAWEPVMQKSKWVYKNGELQQVYRKDKDHPDLSNEFFRYECSCGRLFDGWSNATNHLETQGGEE